jgi:hypothetical protein
MIAYGVMTLLKTATPLAMKGHGFGFGQTAFIIQWHLVGMFAPSFFSGALISRLGILPVMLMGVFAYLAVVAINMQSQTMVVYWFALGLAEIFFLSTRPYCCMKPSCQPKKAAYRVLMIPSFFQCPVSPQWVQVCSMQISIGR